MQHDFQPEYFESFVKDIDETLLMSAADGIQEFYTSLTAVNSRTGIVADGSFSFRLLEYGRHRAGTLQKLGALDAIISREPPKSDHNKAVRAAFELGMAAAEHRILDVYEDYIWEGIAVEEWRAAGLPRAREERLRQGLRTRTAIVNAARRLYEQNPALIRNDSETARLILKQRLPELQKGNGFQVGIDAITRHLRSARNCEEQQKGKRLAPPDKVV
jgi:hypothetical protein